MAEVVRFSEISGILSAKASQVPPEIRKAVADALELFGDKPMQDGLNESVLVQKLAILIHIEGYTADQVARAWHHLDLNERFRPGMAEWSEALEEARRDDRESERIERRIERDRRLALEAPPAMSQEQRESYSLRIAELKRKGLDLTRILGASDV
jgi:hypothetical protein